MLRNNCQQQIFGFDVLIGAHKNFANASGNGYVDIRLHFHCFDRHELLAALHSLICLHGNSRHYARSRRRHLARVGRIGFGVCAANDFQRLVADADFAWQAIQFEKERAGTVGMASPTVSSRMMSVLPGSISTEISSSGRSP
jgi:hypothetical protein